MELAFKAPIGEHDSSVAHIRIYNLLGERYRGLISPAYR